MKPMHKLVVAYLCVLAGGASAGLDEALTHLGTAAESFTAGGMACGEDARCLVRYTERACSALAEAEREMKVVLAVAARHLKDAVDACRRSEHALKDGRLTDVLVSVTAMRASLDSCSEEIQRLNDMLSGRTQ